MTQTQGHITYSVFNKSTGLVEVSCDIVFDETMAIKWSKLILMN
jgi:hypothetical protein